MPEYIKMGPMGGPVGTNVQVPNLKVDKPLNLQVDSAWNEYDKGYRPEYNQEYNRAENQAWYDQVWKGFVSRGLSVGTKVAAGFGSLYYLPSAITQDNISLIWDNPITNVANEADEALKERFPAFQSQAYSEGGFWQKLLTTSFWANEGFDGLAYLASAYAPGKAFGAMTNGAGNLYAKAFQITAKEGLLAIGANAHKTSLVASTLYNTIAEAGAEAHQTQKELEEVYISQGKSPEEAKQLAAKGATETFAFNTLALLLPNFVQSSFLHGGWNNKLDDGIKKLWASGGDAAAAKQTSSYLANIAKGFGSEGLWEENIQEAIQSYERKFALGLRDGGILGDGDIATEMFANTKGFAKGFLGMQTTDEETQGALAIALGGIIGGSAGVMGAYKTNQELSAGISKEKDKYDNLFKVLGPAAEKLFMEDVKSLYKKKQEKLKIPGPDGTTVEMDDFEMVDDGAGNLIPVKDDEAIVKKVINELRNKTFFEAAAVSAYKNDPVMSEYNDKVALASFAYALATNPNNYSMEQINAYLDKMGDTGTEEAKKLGKETFIKENLDLVRKFIQDYQDINKKHGSLKDSENPDDLAFNSFIKKVDFYLNVKDTTLASLPATKQEAIDTIANMRQDITDFRKELLDDPSKIKAEYLERVRTSAKRMTELQSLMTNKDKTNEETDRMNRLHFEYQEEQSINGTYDTRLNTGAGFGIATPSHITTKVIPGSRDSHARNLGFQILAYSDLAGEITDPEARPADLAAKFIHNTAVATPEARDMQGKVQGKLNGHLQILDAAEDEQGLLNIIFDNFDQLADDESTSVDEIVDTYNQDIVDAGGESMTPEEMDTIKMLAIQEIGKHSGVSFAPDAEVTGLEVENIIKRENLLKAKSEVQEALDAIQKERSITEMYLKDVNDIFIDNAKVARETDFNASTNKEQFLASEFLDSYVIDQADDLIERYEKNPDNFEDLNTTKAVLSKLRQAKASYAKRDDLPEKFIESMQEAIDLLLAKINDEVYAAVLKAAERRSTKQIESNRDAVGYSLRVLSLVKPDGSLNTESEIGKLFAEIVGKKELQEAFEAIVLDKIVSLDGINLLIDLVKNKATEEQLDKLKELMTTARDASADELKRVHPKADIKQMFSGRKDYVTNPHMLIANIISIIFYDQYYNNTSSIFYKYSQDKDLNDLVARSKIDNSLTEVDRRHLEEIRRAHYSVVYANAILDSFEKDSLDFKKVHETKKTIQGTIKPSLQQNIVLTDLLRFMFKKLGNKSFENYFTLQGIGGAGKTLVVGNIFAHIYAKLMNKKVEDVVLAFSHTAETSKNINKAIFGEKNTPATTIESFEAMKIEDIAKYDVIVIDEAFALSREELEKVNIKLNQVKTKHNKTVRVVAMGDPSQVVAEKGHPLLNSMSLAATQTISLTTSYRTSVSAISSFVTNYRLSNSLQSNVTSQANMTLEKMFEKPSEAIGVQTASAEEIIDYLDKTSSSRSRVLIVPTAAMVANLSGKLKGKVPVKLYTEVQGFQWEEVYVIGIPAEFGDDFIEINRALYTSMSRAKSFLMVASSLGGVQLEPSAELNASYDEANDELEQNGKMFDAVVNGGNEVLDIFGLATPMRSMIKPTPQVKEVNDFVTDPDVIRGDVSAAAIVDDLEAPFDTSEPVNVPGAVSHVAAYPVNYNIHENTGVVSKGAVGHVIRVKEKKQDALYVVVPSNMEENKYVVVAVLGDYDFQTEDSGPLFTMMSNLKPNVKIDETSLSKGKSGLTTEDIEALSLGTVVISDFVPLRANYAPDSYYQGDDILDRVIIDFYNSFFGKDSKGRNFQTKEFGEGGPSKDWVVDGKVNWGLLRNKVEVRIFMDRTGESSGSSSAQHVGVPYLVIKSPDQRNARQSSKNIFIRMQPAKFSKYSKSYAPIRSLYEAVVVSETLLGDITLGTAEFKAMVLNHADANFEIVKSLEVGEGEDRVRRSLRKVNQPTPVAELFPELELDQEKAAQLEIALDEVVLQSIGIDRRKVVIKDEEEAKKAVDTIIDGYKIVDYVSVGSEQNPRFNLLYLAETGTENTKVLHEYFQSANHGPAQMALNNIAKANEHIGGEKIRITIRGKDAESKFTRSKSLLSPEYAIDYATFWDDLGGTLNFTEEDVLQMVDANNHPTALLIAAIIDNHKGEVFNTPSGYPIKITDEKSVNQLIDEYRSYPMTSELLDKIVGDNAFDEEGNHLDEDPDTGATQSLREPLNAQEINSLGSRSGSRSSNPDAMDEVSRAELASLLSTSFIGMQRTNVIMQIIGVTTDEGTVGTGKKLNPKTIGEGLDMITSTKPYLAPLVRLFKNISFIRDIPINYYREVDGVTDIAVTRVKANGETYIDATLNFGDIGADLRLAGVFLHEVIHAATLAAINRVKRKQGSAADEKLYRRLLSIQRSFNAYLTFTLKLRKDNPDKSKDWTTVYQKTRGKYDVAEFVANLSNKKFYDVASKRQVGKNLLTRIIDALLEWFGLTPETSIYDATFKALEDFMEESAQDIPQGTSAVDEADIQKEIDRVQQDVELNLKTKIKTYKAKLRKAEEEENDSQIDYYQDLIDQFEMMHSNIYDFKTNKFIISDKPLLEQLELLNNAHASLTQKDDSRAAIYTVESTKSRSTPGVLLTTSSVTEFVDNFGVWDYDQPHHKYASYLLRTIIQEKIINPDSTKFNDLMLIGEMFNAKLNNPEELSDYEKDFIAHTIFNSFMDYRDKNKFKRQVQTDTSGGAIGILTDEFMALEEVQAVRVAALLLQNKKEDVSFLFTQTVDSNIDRYLAAKTYVLKFIHDAMNSKTGIIKTKAEIISELAASINPKKDGDTNKYLDSLDESAEKLRTKAAMLIPMLSTSQTAQAEYSQLMTKLIPEAEHKAFGIRALGTKNLRTNREILFDILNDIYPRNKFGSLSDLEGLMDDMEQYSAKQVEDFEAAVSDGLKPYMKDESKSYELTLSESLKDYLSFIPDGDTFMNAGLAYIKTMHLVLSLDWDTTTSGLEHIYQQLVALENEKASMGETDLKILKNLIHLIRTARTSRTLNLKSSLPSNVALVSHVAPSGRVGYAAIYVAPESAHLVPNLHGLSYQQAKRNKLVKVSALSEHSQYLYDWMNETNSTGDKINHNEFNTMFKRAEAINALRELHNVMASMYETELYISTRKNKFGNHFTYIRAKGSDITFGIKEDIIANLRDLHNNGKLHKFKSDFKTNHKIAWNKLNASSTIEERIDAVVTFLRAIGVNVPEVNGISKQKWAISLSNDNIADVVNTIKNLITSTSSVIVVEDDGESDAEVNESTEDAKKKPTFKSFSQWIDHNDGRLTKLTELVSKSSTFIRNSSVKDSKGRKFYKIHESTFAYDMLNRLIKSKEFKGSKGTSAAHKVPDVYKTTLFEDNIFSSGLNTLFAIGVHEASKNLDSESVTPLTRENLFFFYHREFAQGFLDGVRQYQGEEYFNFMYPPSDKPKYPLARVGVLSDAPKKDGTQTQVDEAITNALMQIFKRFGTTFNFDNYNKSLEVDPFRNFEIGRTAMQNLGLSSLTLKNIPTIAKEVKKVMETEASGLLDKLLADGVELSFDIRTYDTMAFLKDKVAFDGKMLGDLAGGKFFTRKMLNGERQYAVNKNEVLPAFDLFFKNHYLNNYFLNQFIAGDYMFYKKNSLDIVKRYAGVFGPGIRPLVDDVIGIQKTYRTLVLEDTNVDFDNSTRAMLERMLYSDQTKPTEAEKEELERIASFFSDNYDMTDGQGFMTPDRFEQLTRGLGRAWGTGNVMKPMYFSLKTVTHTNDKGEVYTTSMPIYVKYSSVVLTDELVERFPMLKELRKKMYQLNADEMVFRSGVKEGAPTGNKLNFMDLLSLPEDQIDLMKNEGPILELNNIDYRLQHNPATDPEKDVSMFSQLMYFLNIYKATQEEAAEAYQLVSNLIKLGREEFLAEISTASVVDKAKLKKFLISKFDGPGAERALDLLQAGVSLNQPLLEKKAIIGLASGIEKAAIKVKFPGGKLILQTAEASEWFIDPTTKKESFKTLNFVKETFNGHDLMFAEVIMPEELMTQDQLDAIKSGKSIYLYGDAMGFRIPSTELHSALALKIVGTYPSKGTNVVIVPKELVPIHGSDFDVDALFVITRNTYTANNIKFTSAETITELISEYNSIYDELDSVRKEFDRPTQRKFLALQDAITKSAQLQSEASEIRLNTEQIELEYNNFINNPNFSAKHGKEIVRAEQDGFKDRTARKEFSKLRNYTYSKGVWAASDPESDAALLEMAEKVESFIEENKHLLKANASIGKVINKLKEVQQKVKQLRETNMLGEQDQPVGYVLKDGQYRLDSNYLESTDERIGILEHITRLEDLLVTIDERTSPVFNKVIKKEIIKLKALEKQYYQNAIIEVMLKTITARENRSRMVTPITFDPITKAIDNVARTLGLVSESGELEVEKLIGNSKDLSNIDHKQRAVADLKDGQVLTGAFANAVKVFAYLSRAGGDVETVKFLEERHAISKELDSLLSQIENQILEKTEDVEKQIVSLKKLLNTEYGTKARRKVFNASRATSTPATLNPRYRFLMNLNGNEYLFDRLQLSDIRMDSLESNEGLYHTTEVFDTLINAAIDNLKLNHLGRARINSATGSAAVGLLSVGMPIDTFVKMMYLPIFDPLSTGKINRVDRDFISKIETKYKKQLESIDVQEVSLSDIDIENILERRKAFGLDVSLDVYLKTHESDLTTLLQAFMIFKNGHTIGEDMRNLSKFLNIVREVDVFIEDLDAKSVDFSNNIGDIMTSEHFGQRKINPRLDFSLNIAHMFTENPHINEAYTTHEVLMEIINKNFAAHGAPIRKFATDINKRIQLGNTLEEDTAQANLAATRREFISYILSGLVADVLIDVKQEKLKLSGSTATILNSKQRTFSEKTARRLRMIKTHANMLKDSNAFLEVISIGKDEYNVDRVTFRGGVNLNSTDVERIVKGFKELNKYKIVTVNGVDKVEVVNLPSTSIVSDMQAHLLVYAILNYGLEFSTSNFSNYIPATMLLELDMDMNASLQEVIKKINAIEKIGSPNLSNEQAAQIIQDYSALLEHFTLSYALNQAERLPAVTREMTLETGTYKTPSGDTARTYNGYVDIPPVKDEKKSIVIPERRIYYDLATTANLDKSNSLFVRRSHDKRTDVYKLIHQQDGIKYYQRVGKASEAFYLKTPNEFSFDKFFSPDELTVHYTDATKESKQLTIGDKFKITSFTSFEMLSSTDEKVPIIEVGDEFWVIPSYNIDRTERVRVKLVEKPTVSSQSKFRSFNYSLEVVPYNSFTSAIEKVLARPKVEGKTISTEIGDVMNEEEDKC